MIKKNIKNTFILLTAFFILNQQMSPLYSQDFGGKVLPSLQWQKQELASKISAKIEKNIKPIIKSNDYLIDVQIDTSRPKKPEFHKTDEEKALEQSEEVAKKVEEKGLSPDEMEAREKAELAEKEMRENKNKVRLSDVDPKDLIEDSILFSKLGLEAPLIEDFNDFRPSGKIILTYGDLLKEQGKSILKAKENLSLEKNKQNELRMKLEALKNRPKPSSIEQIWKYNDSIDVFKNLTLVKVKVRLSKELNTPTRDTLSEILNNINFNLGEITPELTIEYVDMSEDFGKGFSSSTFKELLDWLSKFSTMLGLIGGALLISCLAWVLFKRYEKLQENERSAAAAAALAAESGDDGEKGDDSSTMASVENDSDIQGLNGIERFKTFLSKNEVDASMLVKKWIKIGEKDEINALRSLVQQLENTDLSKIFKILASDERSLWRGYLNETIDLDGLKKANLFISNQIVEEIIVPSAISDPEILDLLLKIRPDKAASFIQENPEEGVILMNVMNTKFIAKIIESLDKNKVDGIIDSSLDFDESIILDKIESLKEKLMDYQTESVKKPFLDRIRELIPMAAPSRENALYKALGKTGDQDSLYKLAIENFPAILIAQLPSSFLKSLLQKYPMELKVEMFLSVEEGLKEHFISAYAPAGSKANDMLELEFDKVKNDLLFHKKIKEEREDIWRNFVIYSRKSIKSNKTVTRDVSTLVGKWTEKISNGQAPEQAASSLEVDMAA